MRTILTTGLTTGFLIVLVASATALAQTAPQEQSAVVSAPGSATAMHSITASVLVTGIDKATRKLTFKDAAGKEYSVVAGPQVRNFDQIKLNDTVNVEFFRSLSLELTKADASKDISESYMAERAPIGATPAGAVGQRISAIAEVVAVDEANKTITLKGPRGRTVELEVENPDHFKVVKVGSRVQVEYTEAMAVSVQPNTAATTKK